MSTNKKLIKEARAKGVNLKTLFPRLKVNSNTKLSKYALTKLKKAIKSREIIAPENTKQILAPDRPDIYDLAGFTNDGEYVYTFSERLVITNLYHAQGDCEYYGATFFGGKIDVQLIPLFKLPEFMEYQVQIEHEVDEETGKSKKFYDKISVREGDRSLHYQTNPLGKMFDSAEDMLLYLEQYKRHGALIGEGGSFDYIQVCFINFED